MKTLHLLRHAKSAWDQPGLSDRDRGLNKRGRRDAPRMGAALANLVGPHSIAVSPAQRAQLTLQGHDDVTAVSRGIDPAEVVEDAPVDLIGIGCAQIPGAGLGKYLPELLCRYRFQNAARIAVRSGSVTAVTGIAIGEWTGQGSALEPN